MSPLRLHPTGEILLGEAGKAASATFRAHCAEPSEYSAAISRRERIEFLLGHIREEVDLASAALNDEDPERFSETAYWILMWGESLRREFQWRASTSVAGQVGEGS